MMKRARRLLMSATVLVASAVWAVEDSTIKWTVSSDAQQDWNTPADWSPNRLPAYGDKVGMASAANRMSNVRLSTAVEPLEKLTLANYSGVTSRLEVATGGRLVVTNGDISILGHGTYFSGSDVCGELVIAGGVVSNTASGNLLNLGNISHSSCKTERGRAVFRISSGEAYFSKIGYANSWWKEANVIDYSGLFSVSGGRVTCAGAADFPPGCLFNMSGGEMSFVNGNFTLKGKATVSGGSLSKMSHLFCNDDFNLTGGVVCNSNVTTQTVRFRGGRSTLSGQGEMLSGSIVFDVPSGAEASLDVSGGKLSTSYKNALGLTFGAQGQATTGGRVAVRQTGGEINLADGNGYVGFVQNLEAPGLLELSGGSLRAYYLRAEASATCGGTMVIRGTPQVMLDFFQWPHTKGVINNGNRVLMRFEIDKGELNPLYLCGSTANAGHMNLRGVFALHPYGGFQLRAGDYCTIVTSRNDMAQKPTDVTTENYWGKTIDPYFQPPNPGLWHSAFGPEKRDGSVGNITYRSTLTNAAEVANGFVSAEGVPFGWFAVPAQKRLPDWMRVRMNLVAKGTNTVEGLVAGIRKAGYEAKVETAGAYNVCVDLPVERVGVGAADRRVIFDFTTEESPNEAKLGHVVTNAVVTAFGCEVQKPGLMLLLK